MYYKKFFLVLPGMLLLAVIAGCAPASEAEEMPTAALPVNKAFADGKEIYFVHLEASDENAAQQMTEMMDSPTLYVPSLAKVPVEALANVYSFKNGADGQVSVLDNPPGTEGYTPLRQLIIVIWADGVKVLRATGGDLSAGDSSGPAGDGGRGRGHRSEDVGWVESGVYLAFFAYGYLLLAIPSLGRAAQKHGIPALIGGVLITAIGVPLVMNDIDIGLIPGETLRAFNIWFWVLAMIGLCARYLDFENRFSKYANEAVLPFYILHQPVILLIGYYVIPLNLSILAKYLIIMLLAFSITLGLYEFGVRRVSLK